jgi:hypothetical protein
MKRVMKKRMSRRMRMMAGGSVILVASINAKVPAPTSEV